MKHLSDKDVIEIFREEWNRRVAALTETVSAALSSKVGGEEEQIISTGLKVTHKGSGLRYTVDSVGPRDVILLTPEGEKILIDGDELEKDYEI